MKLLITGSNGLIAQSYIENISDKFFKNNEIHLTSNSESVCNFGLNFHKVNLHNEKQIKNLIRKINPDVLIHFAWDVKNKNYLDSLTNKFWYQTSRYLIDEFYFNGGQKFIGIGTLAEYSPKIEEIFLNSNLDPYTLYGLYKLKLFEYLESKYTKKYTWIRLGSVLNIHSQRINLFKYLMNSLKYNLEIVLPDLRLPYMNISTYGYYINQIIEKKIDNFQINLGAHIPISTTDVMMILKSKLNRDIKYSINQRLENYKLSRNYFVSCNDKINYDYGIIDSREEFKIFANVILRFI